MSLNIRTNIDPAQSFTVSRRSFFNKHMMDEITRIQSSCIRWCPDSFAKDQLFRHFAIEVYH